VRAARTAQGNGFEQAGFALGIVAEQRGHALTGLQLNLRVAPEVF
jgi:hypothetical protein